MSAEPLYNQTPSFVRTQPIFFVVSILLMPVGIGIIMFLYGYLNNKSKRLTVYPEELSYEEGLLSKSQTELRLSSVRSVRVHQSFWGRLVGIGTLSIYSAGDNAEFVIKGIPDPQSVKQLIRDND